MYTDKRRIQSGWLLSALTLFVASIAGCGNEAVNVPDTAPMCSPRSPLSAQVALRWNSPLSATFNKPVNCSSLTTGTFTVTALGGASVAGAVTCSGSTATFAPTSALVLHTLYTAAITTGSQTWQAWPWCKPIPGILKQW